MLGNLKNKTYGSCLYPNLDKPTVKKTFLGDKPGIWIPLDVLCFYGIILGKYVVTTVNFVIKISQTFTELIGICTIPFLFTQGLHTCLLSFFFFSLLE